MTSRWKDLNDPEREWTDQQRAILDNAKRIHTRPHGEKDMGESGDSTFTRPDGSETSVRAVDADVVAARGVLADHEERFTAVREEIEAADEVAASRYREAQEALADLDERLNAQPSTGDLEAIRSDLADTAAAVRAASTTAAEANTAALAASQAALEAAGIAASKGRIIVQEDEPTGADRSASNIWIKPIPDDPATEVEEKAITHIYLEATDEWVPTTSSELAQAAQNALDAREAAQQAQQRADLAVADAAAAQGAAEAAQRTADGATLSARDAHNVAVEAQARLAAAIEAGDSLIVNGGWETSLPDGTIPGWQNNAVSGGRSAVVVDPSARSGSRLLRITAGTTNTYPESDPLLAVEPGSTLRFRVWVRPAPGGTTTNLVGIVTRQHDASRTQLRFAYPRRIGGGTLASGAWNLLEGDMTVPEDCRYLRVAPHVTGPTDVVYDFDDLQVLDVTDARAAAKAAEDARLLAASKTTPEQVQAAITLSANGKNAIKVSPVAPTTSTPGVVPGDTWWQVDGAGAIFGQWTWFALPVGWQPASVRSEVIANLDVGKLTVTGTSRFTEAVVERLFADIFTANKITAQQLTIAALDDEGNLAEGSVRGVHIGNGTVTANKLLILGDPANADEVGLVARIASILKLSVENLVVTQGATINEAVILKLASEMVTAGVIRTAAAGPRVEVTRSGVVLWGADAGGIESELVRIGPSGENLITVGETTVSASGVTSAEGDFELLRVGGQELNGDILAAYPRGVVGFAYEVAQSAWDGTGNEIVRLQAEAPLQPNRRYSVTVDQHFIRTRTAGATTFVELLRWSTTGAVGTSSAQLAAQRSFLASSTTSQTVPGLVGWIDTDQTQFGTAEQTGRFALSTRSAGGRDTCIEGGPNNPIRITIRDEGPTLESTGRSWFHVGTSSEGGTEAPPARPEVKRYKRTYTSTGYRTYDQDGSQASTPDVVQGLYSGGPSRLTRRGGWLFPNMTGDLSGATIESIRVYIWCDHTWSSAGSTVNVATWGSTMQNNLSAFTSISGWKKGSGRWITVPASRYAGFISGATAGIGVIPTSGSSAQYARFRPTGAKIEITYRK